MELDSNYEIARVAEFICSGGFTRVALQFPDELLNDSMRVVQALRRYLNSSVKFYVMADTTYGSCCVDEVGAAHVGAECVVHYGHTCLSSTSTIPALFIFDKASIIPSNCARSLLDHGLRSGKPVLPLVSKNFSKAQCAIFINLPVRINDFLQKWPDSTAVLCGLEYSHAMPEIKKAVSDASSISGPTSMLELLYADVCCSTVSPSETCTSANQSGVGSQVVCECSAEESGQNYNIGGLSWRIPHGQKTEDYLLFWIGLENPTFSNVALTFNNSEIVRYDATEDCLVTDISQQKKMLRRRYYLVEKAKDANMIGILVGTLGAAGYLHMIHQMRDLITQAGKKSYTFVMGRPNPAKLANFPECDIFINISCAQTALLDSKEFLAPIITPFEAILAFDRGSQWTGAYVMEFKDLIASTPSVEREQSKEARFSFIRGGYVEDLDLQDDDELEKNEILSLVNVTEKALQVRDEGTRSVTSIAKSGAEYFASRSYHGLDINSTDSLPGKFLAGRSGKASGYNNEKAGVSNEIAE